MDIVVSSWLMIREQGENAGALDGSRQQLLVLGAVARDTTGQNLAAFGRVAVQQLNILASQSGKSGSRTNGRLFRVRPCGDDDEDLQVSYFFLMGFSRFTSAALG
jgi:hypothetical protein